MPYFAGSDLEDSRRKAAADFNALLSQDVVKLNQHHRALELDLVDVYALLRDMASNPDQFGFKDATHAYWDTCQGQCSDDIDSYVWWDKVHLTGGELLLFCGVKLGFSRINIHRTIGAHRVIANSILLSGSLEPPVVLESPAEVRKRIAEDKRYQSPRYTPQFSRGAVEKAVQEIMAAKATETPAMSLGDWDKDVQDDDGSSSYIYFALMITLILCIGFVWFLKRQKSSNNLAALSNLVRNNGGRGRFTPLRNVETNA